MWPGVAYGLFISIRVVVLSLCLWWIIVAKLQCDLANKLLIPLPLRNSGKLEYCAMWCLYLYTQWHTSYKELEPLLAHTEQVFRRYTVQPLPPSAEYKHQVSSNFPFQTVAYIFFVATITVFAAEEAILSLIYAIAAAIKMRHVGYLSELLEVRLEARKQVP